MSRLNNGDALTRIDCILKEEIRDIKKRRLEEGMDDVKLSDRVISALIVKHNAFPTIKEDAIRYEIKQR
jgi:hypothetical protein